MSKFDLFFQPAHSKQKKLFSWYITFPPAMEKKYKLNFCICCGSCNSIGIFNLLIGWGETGQCSDWLRAWQLTSRIWSHVSWGDWWGEISISPLPARYYILQKSFMAKRTYERLLIEWIESFKDWFKQFLVACRQHRNANFPVCCLYYYHTIAGY